MKKAKLAEGAKPQHDTLNPSKSKPKKGLHISNLVIPVQPSNDLAVAMISPASSFPIPPGGTNVHPLRDSFILDTGTTRHVTNSPTHFVEWLNSSQSSVYVGL